MTVFCPQLSILIRAIIWKIALNLFETNIDSHFTMAPFFHKDQQQHKLRPVGFWYFIHHHSCSNGTLRISIYSNSVKWKGDVKFIDRCRIPGIRSVLLHHFFSSVVVCGLDILISASEILIDFLCATYVIVDCCTFYQITEFQIQFELIIQKSIDRALTCDCKNFVGKTVPRSIFVQIAFAIRYNRIHERS